MSKRILVVVPNDSLGGAEQYLRMVATYFKDEDIIITHFNKLKSSNWFEKEGDIPQQFMSAKSEKNGLFKFIFRMIKKRKTYDYIFTSHIYVNSLIGILLSLGLLKTKHFIARESTSIFLRYTGRKLAFYKLAYKIGYKHMNLLICQTDLMKNQLVENFPRLEKITKVRVIPNPIDLEQVKIKEQEDIKVKLPEEYIVSAGRLIHVKGFDLLIDAYSVLKKRHPKLKLIILGKGDLQKELDEQIASLQLNDEVIMAGHVNNVYKYFLNAKACVVSSRIEGFPNVLLQMMTQNNNVVSTLCAGGIENIPGVMTAEPNNKESLQTALEQVLSLSDNKKNRAIFNEYLNGRDIHAFINKIISI